MSTRILRYEVPVDDGTHVLSFAGAVLHVASRDPRVVEVWVANGGRERSRSFTVVGTGHDCPDGARHVGTALPPGGQLVWHLLEVD